MQGDLIMNENLYDVAVAGGGVSGVCAAIAAARAGASTVLIQNRPVLGGNSSSEIRVWTRGSVGGGTIYSEEMGILGELKLHNMHINLDANVVLWDEVLLDKVLAEENITLLLNTNITSVAMKSKGKESSSDAVESITACQIGSEKQITIFSKCFIDATGDGTIGYLAGANYRIGREDKQEFQESLALDQKDNYVLGSTIMFQSKEEGKPVRYIKPNYAYDLEYIEQLLDKGGRIVNEVMNGCDYWWIEYGGILDTIHSNQDITLELKKLVLGIWNYIKNSGKFNADNLTLEWIGNIPGKRESRRFEGEHMLTQNEILENKCFDDSVCYGGWYMDFHPAKGIYSEEEFCTQIPVYTYNIPYGCLYNKKLDNLLFAGRNISVTHAAFSSTRVMDTCGLIGQVVGEAAAYCSMKEISTHTLATKHMTQLQQNLLKNDMTIFGIHNQEEEDLARIANITASGTRKIENMQMDGTFAMKDNTFFICPKGADTKYLEIAVGCSKDTQLEIDMYESKLPSRFLNTNPVLSQNMKVKKGQSLVQINVTQVSNDSFAKIVIHKNDDVRIMTSEQSMTGYLAGYQDSPLYVNPCVASQGGIYQSNHTINGINRLYGQTNLWISDSLNKESQWLQYEWDNKKTLNQIRITFNPDLSKELPSSVGKIYNTHHGFTKREKEARELVKDYEVQAYVNQEWKVIASIRDNYQRLCVLNMENIVTDKIKIVFQETYGSPYAEVFEVRIY